jgi:polysaccharide export outer membrane protein
MTTSLTITRRRSHATLGRLLAWCTVLAVGLVGPVSAQVADDAASYRLNLRDEIEVQIFDENDLNTSQRIDGRGQIRVQLVGTVVVAGKTVREAEDFIESLYVEKRILRNPMVTIRVLQYAPREVNVLGEVGNPGAMLFPAEINEMDIVDVIAKSGGFTQLARRNRVEVTRIGPDGKATVREINVDDMIRGRSRDGARFMVRPGDTISVPAIIF